MMSQEEYESFGSCTKKGSADTFNFYNLEKINKKLNVIIILVVISMIGCFFSGLLYLRNRK